MKLGWMNDLWGYLLLFYFILLYFERKEMVGDVWC